MRKIIIANWKMNPDSTGRATKLAEESDIEGLVICPPFPFLKVAGKVIKKAELGAQDLFWEEEGPYTGEVSGAQLKDLGVEYVIIGHSERRKLGETDEMAAKKIVAAVKTGLTPILCVGESKKERASGITKEVLEKEVRIDLSLVASGYTLNPIIIAYEPIWAIGTGVPDKPENTVEMAKFIKKTLLASGYTLNPIIIYGGSVNSKNAKDFLKHKEIEGALVGGASLDAEEIKKIVEISKKYA